MITIAIDTLGGDRDIEVRLKGLRRFIRYKDSDDICFELHGKGNELERYLRSYRVSKRFANRCTIVNAPNDIPMDAGIRELSEVKHNLEGFSMSSAILSVENGHADAVVSAGNTAALTVLAKRTLGLFKGIELPIICSEVPTLVEPALVLDLGANIAARDNPRLLVTNAHLGVVAARCIQEKDCPTVALLSNGNEDAKGTPALKEAARILREHEKVPESLFQFAGFIEPHDVRFGQVDVVVTDGFTGNIFLKTMEGTGRLVREIIKEEFKQGPISLLGAAVATGAIMRVRKRLDYQRYNGGPFLGLRGLVVKSHGGVHWRGFGNAVEVAATMARGNLVQKIEIDLSTSGIT